MDWSSGTMGTCSTRWTSRCCSSSGCTTTTSATTPISWPAIGRWSSRCSWCSRRTPSSWPLAAIMRSGLVRLYFRFRFRFRVHFHFLLMPNPALVIPRQALWPGTCSTRRTCRWCGSTRTRTSTCTAPRSRATSTACPCPFCWSSCAPPGSTLASRRSLPTGEIACYALLCSCFIIIAPDRIRDQIAYS